jgi:antitoxin (DNA-binding transcriptional repressor) of toxin-antitoxin stability system
MKKVTVKQLADETAAIVEIAQSERVVVTENGKPSAVMLGVKFKDEEDYALEKDAAFWQMIRERRKRNKWIPWEEAKKRLGLTSKPKKKVKDSRK